MVQPVHVISLARSLERRQQFEAQNGHLQYGFVDAVDGAGLSPDELRTGGLFEPGLPYTRGAYGCALSHLRLWEQAMAAGEPVTVAEDDAIFRLDFHAMQARVLTQLPAGWDFVLWGWNFDSVLSLNLMPEVSMAVMVFSPDQLWASVDAFRSLERVPTLLPLDKAFGTPAYTISPKGAQRFRSLCFPQRQFEVYVPLLDQHLANEGIDISMNRIYSDTASHVCLPPLVATLHDPRLSTVRDGRVQAG